MIDEFRHRNLGCQFFQATYMVAVVVRRYHVVDLLHAGRLNDGHNAVGIAAPGAARIHQERLAGGGDIQRRVPALGVDEIDVQSLGRPALCAAHRRSQGEGQ